MASRSKPPRRREPDADSLEALKPLVVLGLLGMILYGAYSIVQKGPAAGPPPLPEAPPFQVAEQSAPPDTMAAAPQVELPPATVAAALPASPAVEPPSSPVAVPAPPSTTPVASAEPPPATPSTPTYLSAQSAPPPESAAVESVTAAVPPPAAFPAAATERAAPLSSAAFATAWADAHDKLAAGRYAEALAVLSAWHDDSSLGLEESQRLDELLGQLAGTVIYSQQDLLLPPHVVAAGETLDAIAAGYAVPWQLLAKINGVDDPQRLMPGEAIKLVRGPFDAVVSVSRRRMSLQVAGNYAGTFPVVVGRGVQDRIGASLAVAEIRRAAGAQPTGTAPEGPGSLVQQVAGQIGAASIVLNEGLRIEAADDPVAVSDSAPDGVLIVSPRDLNDLVDILGPGSHVLIRQ